MNINEQFSEELIEALKQASLGKQGRELEEAIEPILTGVSWEDRLALGRLFTGRMIAWDKEERPRGGFRNPYAPIADRFNPPGGS